MGIAAVVLHLLIRIASALYSPITDADETFNYLEPLHYLLHGYGFQTWEYNSGLRSWSYLLPYSFLLRPLNAYPVSGFSSHGDLC